MAATGSKGSFPPFRPGASSPEGAGPEVCLVIESPEALALIRLLPDRPSVVVARHGSLDRDLLARVAPDRVVFPLVGTGFDALHMVVLLNGLGYGGLACAVTGPLPDRAMVERELRAHAPGLNFHIVELRSA
ncbi:hypothetical protein RNZ50_11545 [Paracoccaceae bacterium Fryx2]|nr:hypothetical protein [Paracoccaceae bacterium Fryx2]